MLPADPHAVDPGASPRNRVNDRSADDRPARDDCAAWTGAAGSIDTAGAYDCICFFRSKDSGYRQKTEHKNQVFHRNNPFGDGSHASEHPAVIQSARQVLMLLMRIKRSWTS
jgi:hypothetical protein